ncbi:hypothetical protein [Halobellus rarus]|uniref:Uncharacterized protein n=1 Tax=Halobellus rarus TaxID=1126237 RepID=A0ABD6CKB1_9EURY|nr:hypothetical protein [Halobellus rarus]
MTTLVREPGGRNCVGESSRTVALPDPDDETATPEADPRDPDSTR